MDSSRGVMSGTMDRFKMVHELDMLYYVAVIYITTSFRLWLIKMISLLCRYLRRNLTGECVLLLCALWFPS